MRSPFRFLPGAILAGVFLTTSLPVCAQTEATARKRPFRVSLGTFIFGESSTREALTPITAEVGYDFLRLGKQDPVVFQVYADYFGYDSGIQRGGDLRLTLQDSFGIGISVRSDTLRSTSAVTPYIGIGVGYYFMRASTENIPGGVGYPAGSQRLSGLYPKFLLGAQTRNGLFAEAEFQLLPEFDDISFNRELRGVNLRVGYAF